MTTTSTSHGLNRLSLSAAVLAAVPLLCLPAAAQAQSFTFSSVDQPIREVALAMSPTGQSNGSIVYSKTTLTMTSDGRTIRSTGDCTAWVRASGAPLWTEAVCSVSDASGARYTFSYSCETAGAECLGKLIGVGGDRTATIHFTAAARSHGYGAWGESARTVTASVGSNTLR